MGRLAPASSTDRVQTDSLHGDSRSLFFFKIERCGSRKRREGFSEGGFGIRIAQALGRGAAIPGVGRRDSLESQAPDPGEDPARGEGFATGVAGGGLPVIEYKTSTPQE